ncbi:MAG: Sm ribonucleo [Thermoprotei archaeon]|nr:MAG: Sm ribonucleo [Thermoprotei archaeon]RLF02749.1 MAG: Sm ribonucleo [Thermoprotei archaeon]
MSVRERGDSPLKLLIKTVNNNILVKLKDGSEFIGILEQCDPTMNLVLGDAKEVNETNGELLVNYGKVFIRGSNILFIAINSDKVTFE